MDVNATLIELRALTVAVLSQDGTDAEWTCNAERVAELFAALDGWIMRSGFLPSDWHRAMTAMLRGDPVLTAAA
jgi:hypothetical protein